MSWKISSHGDPSNKNYTVLEETITLGAAKGNRYSDVFSVPNGVGFTVISNTAGTNLSGSASDQLYVSYDGTNFYQKVNTLRDANYKDDTNQGTSYRSIDSAARVRYVDQKYLGPAPYYKIRILQAAVESSAKTVGLAVIIGKNPRDPFE